MAKGVTNATKFVRSVLAKEIENPANQPYTVGTAAGVIAYLRTAASEMLDDDWVHRYGIDVPEDWRTPRGKFGDKDPSGAESQAHKDSVKYGRKFIETGKHEPMTLQTPCPSWINHPPNGGNLSGQSWENPFPDSRCFPGVFPEGSIGGIH